MARELAGKISVEGTLVAETPISVGGIGVGDSVDIELAVNGRGDWYIPGSSIMGPMRHWVETRVVMGSKLGKEIFGFQKTPSDQDGEEQASFLFVDDAKMHLPGGCLIREIRDGIQILRTTGAARESFKYTRAVLPRGTAIKVKMELDIPKKGNNKHLFAAVLYGLLLEMIENGLYLGAGKTRGFGHVKFRAAGEGRLPVEVHRYNFEQREDFDRWLSGKDLDANVVTPAQMKAEAQASKEGVDFLRFKLHWKPLSPIMVKSGRDGTEVDMVPLVSGIGKNQVAPVLPGSAIKGCFRSHAAKIVRTLMKEPEAFKFDPKNPDPDQIKIIEDLFGGAEQAGRIAFSDVYQDKNPVDRQEWFEEKDQFREATVHADHVAIDRFTGGASEGALYSTGAPRTDMAWEDIGFSLDFSRPVNTGEKDNPMYKPLAISTRNAQLALVLLVLRDLCAGRLPLGFATHRGMGDIEVTGISVSGMWGKEEKGYPLDSSGHNRRQTSCQTVRVGNAACGIPMGTTPETAGRLLNP